ncbi:neutral ceramidase-like [Daphnia pulex]|uniref:neutral ceramidase-like n=1 Tax=Daphnia pulex TaxID=6669 RepID=UPI001EE1333E|nr:neutral ceramidase-like [Daphnia pulex]
MGRRVGKTMELLFRLVVLSSLVCHVCFAEPSVYQVGAGIADVTGPAADINMMGYANPAQLSAGIHTRQYSRAFIVDDGSQRVVFISVDCALMDQVIKTEVSRRLETKFEGVYTAKNVVISGTHTHSGPGGYLQYVLFLVTSKGWVQQSYDALVQGIVQSVERAHDNMIPANIYYASDILIDANINRSPASYLNNPSWERAKYTYNTDKDMVQLKFVSTADGKPIGVINWYAVHCTSMNNTNPYISSDNKGYAGLLFEAEINGPDIMPGKGPFVAAFASTNLGDVSPNTMGAKCIDTGLPCDFVSSSCNNRTQLCIAFGPGKDMVESTQIIGDRQFQKAWNMYDVANTELEALEGPVQFAHQFVDMPNYNVEVQDPVNGPTTVKLCKPAMGYSFAAGTTDGPGAFDFTQGVTSPNDFWNLVGSALVEPSEEVKQCQSPKPVLLSTGEISWPYAWHPDIVETQILRIGQFLIAAVPGEFTTMAGRRLRDALNSEAINNGGPSSVKTVIAGLSNGYTHYITTFEEYQIQRYEGASTIYGPHTHSAYLDQYRKLTRSIFKSEPVDDGPTPPFLLDEQISLVPGVVFDRPAFERKFGDCLVQPYPFVRPNETVTATFVAGHPRNNLMLGNTFMTVEAKQSDNSWKVIRTDAHFDTFFFWERTSAVGQSEAHLRWIVPADTPEGEYRISHFGHYKNIDASVVPYYGTTQSFSVGA